MRIDRREVLVKDVFAGYVNDGEDGVFAYGGKLTIRPPYQREFVYDDERQRAVIHTVLDGFPLNTMYWAKTGDDTYEVLDGQQRTLSIMEFLVHHQYVKINGETKYCDNLTEDQYGRLMAYPLTVYVCEGTPSEKLAWFRVVNIGGVKLEDQELLNASYTGSWLTAAKVLFSKRGCNAKRISDRYIVADPIRQKLLETALKGICEAHSLRDVSEYMGLHQHDLDADELWQYFQKVINWVNMIFPEYHPDMKGRNWCHLYNVYHENAYNSNVMCSEVRRLHTDDEVGDSKGIYEYLLARDTDPFAGRLLNLRTFDERDKIAAYQKQNGLCAICKEHFEYNEMEGDHIQPWSKGGKTVPENLQMLCRHCNGQKTDKY